MSRPSEQLREVAKELRGTVLVEAHRMAAVVGEFADRYDKAITALEKVAWYKPATKELCWCVDIPINGHDNNCKLASAVLAKAGVTRAQTAIEMLLVANSREAVIVQTGVLKDPCCGECAGKVEFEQKFCHECGVRLEWALLRLQ